MRYQGLCRRTPLVQPLLPRNPPELTHISRSRQFKYFAKDFGDTESERLITLARLMGSKGNALLKVKLPFDTCAIHRSLPPLNLAAVV